MIGIKYTESVSSIKIHNTSMCPDKDEHGWTVVCVVSQMIPDCDIM